MNKQLSSIFFTLLFVAACATLSFAQSVSGNWDTTITSPQGAGKSQLALKQEGEALSGTIKSELGELPVKGTLKGKDIKLTFSVKFQDNDLLITLSGKLDGDALKSDADFGGLAQGDWAGKKGN